MTTTWHALIAALLLLTFTSCGHDRARDATGPSGDSIIGYDLALAPLHYADAAGHVYELLLAVGNDGAFSAACYIVDGAPFATIMSSPSGADADIQLYQDSRAVFRGLVTPAAVPSAAAWPSFAAAAAETRDALVAWQGSASADALAQLHAALGRLASASTALVAPVTAKGG